MKHIFDLAEIINYQELLAPLDRQNVPAMLKLAEKLNECISKIEHLDNQICKELKNSIQINRKIE